jgi:hypothetical protein
MVVCERGTVVCGWRHPCKLEGGGCGRHLLGAVVCGSGVVGWVFGCGQWDLHFVLAMGRERGVLAHRKNEDNEQQ